MLSRTSASPDVAFTCPPGTHSTAVKQNAERGSLCLDCPYARSHPSLSTQLRVHVLEKGFPELADIIAPSAAPYILLHTCPGAAHAPLSGVIHTRSGGSFWTWSLLRAEPQSPSWSPRLQRLTQGPRKDASWSGLWVTLSLPSSASPHPHPLSWSLRCLGPFCLTGPEGEVSMTTPSQVDI